MQIMAYTEDLESSVRSFNQRLTAGGGNWHFPESHRPQFPKVNGRVPYQEFFLAVHRGAVRGGYLLTHNRFALRGEEVTIACGPQHNVSEGLIDPAFAMVGVIQAQDALRRQPLMYALGMGGLEKPLTKLLLAMEWSAFPVPFYFRVLSPARFLENITYLRKAPRNRIILDLLRYSRLGFLGLRLAQARLPAGRTSITGTAVDSFAAWADQIWEECRSRYSLVGMRNSSTLDIFYPPEDARFIRLRVSSGNRDLGWAVLLDTQMRGHKQFGNMRVGSIVDCLAEPDNALCVVRCCTSFLEERGVDLIVTNQASSAWGKACISSGYLKGPTNFILVLSPRLAARLEPLKSSWGTIHINRGDGDGPINL
jgi:hypothetical protein